MSTPRNYRPERPATLEDRVVPSHSARVFPHARPAAEVAPAGTVPGAPAPGTSSGTPFARDTFGTIRAGLPVYGQRTTVYPDGTSAVEDRLIVPEPAGMTTTTGWISLRGGGAEKVVDVASTAGAVTTHATTTTLPDGTTETTTETDTVQGPRTLISATVQHPGGGFDSITGTRLASGPRLVSDRTITAADGSVRREVSVTVLRGEFRQTNVTTTTPAGGVASVTRSTTTIARFAPPAG